MDETFIFTSASDGNVTTASFDGGAGNDTLDATFGAVGFATGGLTTSFTANGDGTFSATYRRGNAAAEGDDSVSIVNIENVFIAVLGDSNGVGNEDYVRTGGGNDRIFTDNGNDHIDAGRGVDTVDGGSGDEFSNSDRISKDFSDRSVDIRWNIQTGFFSGPGSFVDVEAFGLLQTGSGDDKITTSNFSNGSGLPGDEAVSTGAGDDLVTVSNGVDDVSMGGGDDRLIVNYLNASFPGSIISEITRNPNGSYSGEHRAVASDGLRTGVTFSGVEHFTLIYPESGGNGGNLNDTIFTGNGDDIVSAGASSDLIHVGRGIDQVDGGEIGTDVDGLAKDFGADAPAIKINLDANTYSGPGSYTNLEWFIDLKTGGGNDVVVTSGLTDSNDGGDDLIATRGGNDRVTLFNGNDEVDMGGGNDRLIVDYATFNPFTGGTTMTLKATSPGTYSGFIDAGFAGMDVKFAGVENFTILTNVSGGNGFNLQDLIVTGNGDDVVETYASDDRIYVGRGLDKVDGGSAVDGLGKDFSDRSGDIKFNLQTGFLNVAGSFKNLEYFLDLRTGSGDDVIKTGRGNYNDVVATGGGADTATFFQGVDSFSGGAGSDRLILDYRTNGGAWGPLVLTKSSAPAGGLKGSIASIVDRQEVEFKSVEHFTIYGVATAGHNETIATGGGDDVVWLFGGNDLIDGRGGDDQLFGGTGNDTLLGREGIDKLKGQAGDDRIEGGGGA